MTPGGEDVSALLDDEQRLVFNSFDDQTAWELGSAIRAAGAHNQLPIAVEIRRGTQVLFHAALPGAAADNDDWLARKAAVVARFGHSSYYIGCKYRADGLSFDADSRLDTSRYAAHGGAFPIIVRSAGCIGSVAVSGLSQRDDHRFVVGQLERFLTDTAGPLTEHA